jgi:uncharacterized protein with PIN domain
MSDEECPECGSVLEKRSANVASNVRRRKIDSIWDRYVCRSCRETFSRREIEDVMLSKGWFWE